MIVLAGLVGCAGAKPSVDPPCMVNAAMKCAAALASCVTISDDGTVQPVDATTEGDAP